MHSLNYIVITKSGYRLPDVRRELQNEVNAWIARGFVPQGGVSISKTLNNGPYDFHFTLAQAMIKNN